MPIYEYYCERCDKRFERLKPMSTAGQPQSCPSCNEPAPAAVSRTVRMSGQGEEAAVGDADAPEAAAMPGRGHGHSHGGHGHSHGPMGHTH